MSTTTARRLDEPCDLPEDRAVEMTGTETIVLSDRDWEAIRADWENPSDPTPEAVEAVRRYRSLRLSDGG